jgi:hypothetical protein
MPAGRPHRDPYALAVLLNDEHRLLLLAALAQDRATAEAAYRTWSDRVDPQLADHASGGLFGLLGWNLERHGIACADSARWAGVRRHHWATALLAGSKLGPAIAAPGDAPGPLFLAEGTAVLAALPEPAGWSPCRPAAFLVPPAGVDDALASLAAQGWTRGRRPPPTALERSLRSFLTLHKPDAPPIRLHWRFAPLAEDPAVEAWFREGAVADPATGAFVPRAPALFLHRLFAVAEGTVAHGLLATADALRLLAICDKPDEVRRAAHIAARFDAGDALRAIAALAPSVHSSTPCVSALVAALDELGLSRPHRPSNQWIACHRRWRKFRAITGSSSPGFLAYAVATRGLRLRTLFYRPTRARNVSRK